MRRAVALLPAALLAWACASPSSSDSESAPPTAQMEPPRIVSLNPWIEGEPSPPPPEWIAATRPREFAKCTACHNVEKDGKNGVGPNLYGVFGRPAASQPAYRYSQPLQESGLVWDAPTLDRWLANPRAVVPGARMTFSGETNPERRKALIAFLRLRSASRP